MTTDYTQPLVDMGISLAELAIKGTATAVTNKIRTVKDEKNSDRLRSTYDEIVNELLAEREEAIRIAQAYKSELDRIMISDDDIKHLHNTVSRLLEILKMMQLANAALVGEKEVEKVSAQVDSYDQIKELISVDTLKTMQLLGFNYKAAIGEPLTKICSEAIMNLGTKGNVSQGSQSKSNIR